MAVCLKWTWTCEVWQFCAMFVFHYATAGAVSLRNYECCDQVYRLLSDCLPTGERPGSLHWIVRGAMDSKINRVDLTLLLVRQKQEFCPNLCIQKHISFCEWLFCVKYIIKCERTIFIKNKKPKKKVKKKVNDVLHTF